MPKMAAILFFLVLFHEQPFAQVEITGGMGINFRSTPSLKDYINFSWANGDELSSFSTIVEFFGELDYRISERLDLGAEYSRTIFSYNTSTGVGIYDVSYNTHNPNLLIYYVIRGDGYKFKFGGGAGYRVVSLTERHPSTARDLNYDATGFGLVLRFQGLTSLGGSFYANISTDLRYELIGDLGEENTGDKLINNTTNENVNMNSFSGGIRLGLTYEF